MDKALFLAAFGSGEALKGAVEEFRARSYVIHDAYTPYPVHGLDDAMGLKPSRLGWACFGIGAPACLFALAFQSWVATVAWPVNIGGKPFFSWQTFIPVAFEFTVLCAGLGTVAALFLLRRLRPGARWGLPAMGATDDRFVLALIKTDTAFDTEEVLAVCRRHRAIETREHLPGGS